MYLTALRLDGFRNIKNQEIFPCGGVNVIFGNNAQGKTNLIEAIFFCSGLGSFRGAKEAELIPFGQDFLSLSADFFSKGRNRKTEIKISREKKKILLSGVPQKRLSSLCVSADSNSARLRDVTEFFGRPAAEARPRVRAETRLYDVRNAAEREKARVHCT